MELNETFKMKINSKLMLITATLGLMAAASATAMAGNYVYFQNNTNQVIKVSTNFELDNGDIFHRANDSCSVQPGGEGQIEVFANGTHDSNGQYYADLHVKYNGHNEDMAVVRFSASYDGNNNRTNDNLGHAYMGTSAPAELTAMGMTESICGTAQPSGTNQNDVVNQPGQNVYGVGNTWIRIDINPLTSQTKSPMGKITSLFNSIKL